MIPNAKYGSNNFTGDKVFSKDLNYLNDALFNGKGEKENIKKENSLLNPLFGHSELSSSLKLGKREVKKEKETDEPTIRKRVSKRTDSPMKFAHYRKFDRSN